MFKFSTATTQKSMLGEMLVHKNLITREQLNAALARQKETSERLGEAIVAMGLLTEKQLARALVRQKGYRYAIALAAALSAPFAPAMAASSTTNPTLQTTTTTTTNLAPVISGTPATSVTEGSSYYFMPTAYDPEGKALTFKIKNKPVWAIFSSKTGTLSGTPTVDYVGTYSDIQIVASDGKNLTYLPSFSISVDPQKVTLNQVPTATSSSYSTNTNTAVTGTLGASDPNGDPLTFSISTAPAHGTVTITNTSTGAFTYTPAAGYAGADSFTFRATDTAGASATAPISLTINSVNAAPVANSAAVSMNEDSTYQGTLSASDANGDALTYSISGQPSHGTITLTNALTGAFTYTPAANYNGSDSFNFQVNDGHGGVSTATLSLNIQSINDAPTTTGSSQSVAEDGSVTGMVSATDIDSQALTFSVSRNVAHGSLTFDPNTGAYTYRPAANYSGTDSFQYSVQDANGGTASAQVTFTVSSINDAPVAQARSFTGTEDAGLTGTLTATDADGDTLTYSISGSAAHGTVTITNAATGSFSYTPAPNYSGTDSFTFSVSDGRGGQSTAQASINIAAVNDAPVATNSTAQVNEDSTLTGQVTASDLEGSSLTYTVVTTAAHGTVSLNSSNGSFTFVPAPNYNGPDTFTFRVTDTQGGTATAQVSISVLSVDDRPIAVGDNANTTTNTPVTIAVLNNDTNLGDGGIQVSIATQPGHGTASISNNQVVYTPAANYSGTDSISYRITDADGDTAVATIAITATCTQNCPQNVTLNWSAPTTRADGSALTNLAGYLVHYGTSPANYTSTVDVSGGGTLTHTLQSMPAGTYYFSVTAYDTDGNESGYSTEVSKTIN